jgi:hypothetical protein
MSRYSRGAAVPLVSGTPRVTQQSRAGRLTCWKHEYGQSENPVMLFGLGKSTTWKPEENALNEALTPMY